jgi:hypothetical protein
MTTERGSDGSGRRHLASVLLFMALAAEVGVVLLNLLMSDRADRALLSVLPFAIVIVSAYAIVGWLIASRRPGNSIGWIFLAIALSLGGLVFATTYVRYGLVVAPGSLPFADVLSWVAGWAWAPGFTLLVTLSVLLFPNGKPPSPRWRPIIWASFVVMGLLSVPVAIATWTGSGSEIADSLQTMGTTLILFVALASFAGMVVRYRRGGLTERQQLKWYTYAAVPEVAFLVFLGYAASGSVIVPPLVLVVAPFVIAPLLPAAAAVAILRYRLYDLDRLVSRTIAYAVVTGGLVIVYLAINLGLTTAFSSLASGNSVVVAASTLAVAALFTPLRRRVQRVVDRRFDRARVDAEETATAFSERLRDEIDIASVNANLSATVRAALSPSTVALWLREDHR